MENWKSMGFAPIRLEDMDRVKLMNRTDTKYWFHIKHLESLLDAIRNDYYILTMQNEVALPYSTVYYDTAENRMYTAHHNGKLNRYKIRRRTYLLSGISFLEVKFKSNKGRTKKTRIAGKNHTSGFSAEEVAFLEKQTPFTAEQLSPSLSNHFERITLVNKNFGERCTLDFRLTFASLNKQFDLPNMVILEVKADGSPAGSPLVKALREMRIKSSGFSKYCIGKMLTDAGIKQNAFKPKIRQIEKTLETSNRLNNN